jgi:SPP1 family predicted phage head-tail adaptor
MQAGAMDRRVRLERATTTDTGLETAVASWSTLATVWAEKLEISDGERSRQVGAEASATTRFRVRYSATVASLNAKDRAVCEGRTYDIVGVKELGRREGLEITAMRRADV